MGAIRAVSFTIIGIVAIAVVLVGGGLAYTYFLGPDNTEESQTTEEQAAATAIQQPIKASKPSANAPASASVTVLTSPVAPGDNASLTIKTVPTAKCTVAIAYGSVAAKDSGLSPKAADEFGAATWSWTVDKAAPLGTWPVKITCAYNGRTAFVQGDLVVAKMAQPTE